MDKQLKPMTEEIPLLESPEPQVGSRKLLNRPLVRAFLGLLIFIAGASVFIGFAAVTRRPELQPLSRVATLSHKAKLDPHHTHQRLILVGDVHGMYKELQKLLKKVGYDKHRDNVVFLGDMITKGPDSLKVVDFAIENGAYCVRGNHEDEIFRLYADYRKLDAPETFVPYASSTILTAGHTPTGKMSATVGPYPASVTAKSGNEERDMPLVKKLKKRHVEYLQACPAILKLGKVSYNGIEAVAVHGGLLWHEHDLEKQAIEDVLRLRSIVPPDYKHGSEDPDAGDPWFERYNEEQYSRPKDERYEVFYGHDASKGLQLQRYSKGLDTKCQRGGKLSAFVVEVDHKGHYHERLEQVKC